MTARGSVGGRERGFMKICNSKGTNVLARASTENKINKLNASFGRTEAFSKYRQAHCVLVGVYFDDRSFIIQIQATNDIWCH